MLTKENEKIEKRKKRGEKLLTPNPLSKHNQNLYFIFLIFFFLLHSVCFKHN